MTLDEIKQTMSAGDTAKAAESLKEVLANEPDNLQAKMLYGTCCQLLGDEETFKRIHDELASDMEYPLIFHADIIEFGTIETIGIHLFILLQAFLFVYVSLKIAILFGAPCWSFVALPFFGVSAVCFLMHVWTTKKLEPFWMNELKVEPKIVADSCNENHECWICGDKCRVGEAFQVKISGNYVKHAERMFLYTIIRQTWQSVIINVPCCYHCQGSIAENKLLHKRKFAQYPTVKEFLGHGWKIGEIPVAVRLLFSYR